MRRPFELASTQITYGPTPVRMLRRASAQLRIGVPTVANCAGCDFKLRALLSRCAQFV